MAAGESPKLCKGECSAKKRALQRRVLCKEACSAKKRALQEACFERRVLCKGECSAEKSALQRGALCKEEQRRALLHRAQS